MRVRHGKAAVPHVPQAVSKMTAMRLTFLELLTRRHTRSGSPVTG